MEYKVAQALIRAACREFSNGLGRNIYLTEDVYEEERRQVVVQIMDGEKPLFGFSAFSELDVHPDTLREKVYLKFIQELITHGINNGLQYLYRDAAFVPNSEASQGTVQPPQIHGGGKSLENVHY